jgi:hypothetical protein
MERILNLEEGITDGNTVRDIIEVFPEIESRFRQRKTYYEYYFDGATVVLTIEKVANLNQLGFKVSIGWEDVVLS